jgi:hypothetical protein
LVKNTVGGGLGPPPTCRLPTWRSARSKQRARQSHRSETGFVAHPSPG